MASDDRKLPRDPTPIVGAPTDVAPISRSGPKPAHERTADEEADVVDWKTLAASAGFKELIRAKRRFIVPATLFFVLYSFLSYFLFIFISFFFFFIFTFMFLSLVVIFIFVF